MIKTTVKTPANTYQLCVQQHCNQVSVDIDANTPNLAAATFRLTVSDTTIAHMVTLWYRLLSWLVMALPA